MNLSKDLNPFWEDVNTTSVGPTSLTGGIFNDVNITYSGFIDTYPILTFDASSAVASIEIQALEALEGTEITDSIFGTSGFQQMILDNIEGTLFIS